MKSHKTSAFKENNKIKRTVPALDQKDLEEYGNQIKQAWSGLEPECT